MVPDVVPVAVVPVVPVPVVVVVVEVPVVVVPVDVPVVVVVDVPVDVVVASSAKAVRPVPMKSATAMQAGIKRLFILWILINKFSNTVYTNHARSLL